LSNSNAKLKQYLNNISWKAIKIFKQLGHRYELKEKRRGSNKKLTSYVNFEKI